MKKILLLACFLIIGVVAHAQDDCYKTLLDAGISQYNDGNYETAIKKWRVALKCDDRYLTESERQTLENWISKASNPIETTPSHQSYEPEMVTVNGGTFQMGDVMGDNEYPEEKPVHSVTLNTFYLGKYEVSQAEWVAVMGSNPSYFKGDNLPVETVSYEDVQIYLKKLNAKTGKNYRLPTEAEWEYAAREGGKNRRFGNGKNTIDPLEINFDASAEYKKSYSNTGTYRAKTVGVSSFSPNMLGLYNMSGNVWEWCSDWYGTYSSSSQTNPQGATSGSYRVFRGGSCGSYPQDCRASYRNYDSPTYRGNYLGFRVASAPQ